MISAFLRYERLAWLPVLVVFLTALGVGGGHLTDTPPLDPPSAFTILTFASTIAGNAITYAPLSSDFSLYFHPRVSRFVVTTSHVGRVDAFLQLEDLPLFILWFTSSNGEKIDRMPLTSSESHCR